MFYRMFFYFVMLFWHTMVFALDEHTRVAFYYGNEMPDVSWNAFNIVITHPNPAIDPRKFHQTSSDMYAYLNLSEFHTKDQFFDNLPKAWYLTASNETTHVIDLANTAFQDFIIQETAKKLWQLGYRGFFLDTPDSWRRLKLSKVEQARQVKGLVTLVKALRKSYPEARIILNGAYDTLKFLHQDIDAVSSESLYTVWNDEKKRYETVNSEKREILLSELKKIQLDYHLPIIVVDYAPSGTPKETRKIAKAIQKHGFIPWVSNAWLDTQGIGLIEILPRKILVLYDDRDLQDKKTGLNSVNETISILSNLGFLPVSQSLNAPFKTKLKGEYAGIVLWLSPDLSCLTPLKNWLLKQISEGVPIAVMGEITLPAQKVLLDVLHLDYIPNVKPVLPLSIVYQNKMMGYQILPKPNALDFFPLRSHGKPLLSIEDAEHLRQEIVAITEWGGYALGGFALAKLPNDTEQWAVDPVLFFQQALQLRKLPNFTTQNHLARVLYDLSGHVVN